MALVAGAATAVVAFRAATGLFGLLFKTKPPKIEAQRLGELSQQTAKEGEPRPIVYGIGRPIGGNIMYMSQPIKRMVKTYVGKAGGKGGGKKKKQYQDVEHVYRYYAIRVCEGPITGFRRIWRNGALVYDARKGSDWGAKNNHLFFQNYRLYTGSWGQMPDSMLQSRWGMDIPAHRGTAYLVADNEDLTDFGGAIPQWQFEVVRSEGFYLTSRPYALEDEPSSGAFTVSVKESPSTNIVEQSGTTGVAILGGQSSGTWKQSHVDEMNATGGIDRIVMTRTTRYSSMDAGHEEMNATGGIDRIVMTRTTRYSDYIVEPQEMNATGGIDRIIMTRTSGTPQPPEPPHTYDFFGTVDNAAQYWFDFDSAKPQGVISILFMFDTNPNGTWNITYDIIHASNGQQYRRGLYVADKNYTPDYPPVPSYCEVITTGLTPPSGMGDVIGLREYRRIT